MFVGDRSARWLVTKEGGPLNLIVDDIASNYSALVPCADINTNTTIEELAEVQGVLALSDIEGWHFSVFKEYVI
ncbi:hypothetical protein OAJ57_00325 [Alphaproteobacteria bacterium]|nr:hypothetical protein [Alphaproteobacteria bacterium]